MSDPSKLTLAVRVSGDAPDVALDRGSLAPGHLEELQRQAAPLEKAQ
jgi:hypothetical protein